VNALENVDDNSKDQVVADEELIKCAVEVEVKKQAEEERDLEFRKHNLIIFRIPEKKTENVTARKESDMTFVKDLTDCVFDMKLIDDDVTKMYRLGYWDENKSRPLLVSFRNLEQKEQIMSNLSKLKQPIEKFRGVSISHDLHPKEREKRKNLIEAAKLAHVGSSSDVVENYKFHVVGRGTNQRVIKIKRQN